MGFTTDDRRVRVDFFKESGKWYSTEEIIWDRFKSEMGSEDVRWELIIETFKRCLQEQFPESFIGMTAVCLEPYHENAFPVMLKHLKEDK